MSIYTFKNYDTLLKESLTDLAAQTNITQLGPGAKARSLLEIINARIAGAYQYIDQRMANALLASATGLYLDYMGDLLACPRTESTYAYSDAGAEVVAFYVASGTFGDINGGNSITVPAGTTISTNDSSTNQQITYIVSSNATLPANESLWYVSVESSLPGSLGIVSAGTLTIHNLSAYTGLLVKNVYSIANGQDRESDEAYRYRLSKKVTSSAEANQTAVRLACLSVPGVIDVAMEAYARGAATFDVYVITSTGIASDPLINLVQKSIDMHQGYGIIGKARSPVLVGVQFQAQAYLTRALNDVESSITIEALTQATTQYFSTYRIGQTFIVNNLLAALINTSGLIETIGQPRTPFSQLFMWKPSRVGNGRRRFTMTGDYHTAFNEIVQLEVQSGLTAADFRLVTP